MKRQQITTKKNYKEEQNTDKIAYTWKNHISSHHIYFSLIIATSSISWINCVLAQVNKKKLTQFVLL